MPDEAFQEKADSLLGSVLLAVGPALREAIRHELRAAGYRVVHLPEPQGFRNGVIADVCDAVLCDLSPEGPGFEFFREVRTTWDDVPVVVTTGQGQHSAALEALREGAFTLLEGPFVPRDLVLLVGRAVSHRRLCLRRDSPDTQWERLSRLAQHMNESRSKDEFFAVLRRELPALLGVEHFSFYEYNDGSLTLAASTRDAPPMPAISFEEDRPVVTVRNDGTASPLLLVPAFVHFKPVGVLALERPGPAPAAEKLRFLRAAAAHVGNALSIRQRIEALEQALRDLHEVQAEVLRAERLAVVGKIAFDISHEMKNRLTSMTFAVQNVRDAVAGAGITRPEIEDSLALLNEDIRRMRSRVEAFYAMARRPEKEPTPCQVARVVADVLDRFQYDPRRVTLTSRLEPCTARVDAEQLFSAVSNLLLNAFEAVEHTKKAQIHVTVTREDQRIRIVVEDNGPGVPPEIRGRIFDAFYSTKPNGAGLGLSQVFVFAETSGGRVYLDDSSRGACFVIEIPEGRE